MTISGQKNPREIQLEEGWRCALEAEFSSDYMQNLRQFLLQQKTAGKQVYPSGAEIFNALNSTAFDDVKVVILGQDPYHGPGQAHGLCFSVKPGVRVPPSLLNIYKELSADIGFVPPGHGCLTHWATQGVLLLNSVLTVEAGNAASHQGKGWERFTDAVVEVLNTQKQGLVPPSLLNIYKELSADIGFVPPGHGCLTHWATQGVLLLNSVLTVEAGNAASHQGKGWERFTDAVVEVLNTQKQGLVYILWGSYAQKKGAIIDRTKNLVLQSPHPSPLSASRGFFGNHHFSRANEYLSSLGKKVIEWQLPVEVNQH